jgi:glycolate oxidase iron-sulfur subunit
MATVPKDLAGIALPEQSGTAIAPHGAVRDVVEYELLFDCVHCGLCLESCPTYVITRAEMDSPRGRIYLMKALAEGLLELDRDAVRHLDLCLECRGCETACPSGVRYGRLIEHARGYVERNWRRGIVERLRNRIIGAIFPFPARLRAVLAPLRFAEQIGMRRLLRALAPASVRDWLDLLPMLNQKHAPLIPASREPGSPFSGARGQHPETTGTSTVVVHHGCVAQVLSQSANVNCERALAAAGYRVVQLAKTVCCGALDIHHGNLERAGEFARINVATLAASGADSIISAASGCSAVIAQYGELLKDDSTLATLAREVSARVTDLSSLLLDRCHPEPSPSPVSHAHLASPTQSPSPHLSRKGAGEGQAERERDRHEPARGKSGGEFRATVTYHDSCHLAHGLGVREPPRELLRSIRGVRFIELAESDLCCGSAGSYNLTERAMAHELSRRKVDNIIATGAQYVVLSNPGCEFQIAAELKRRGSPIRVVHIADFLALAATKSADD